MKNFIKTFALFASVLASGTLFAQGVKNGVKSKDKDKLDQYDEIIIKKKSDSDKDRKLTIEINKGVVTVNGKKVEEFNDDDLAVIQKKIRIHVNADDMAFDVAPIPPIPPMPPGARANPQFRKSYSINMNDSRGFLGVKTEKDNGAKVTEVTEGTPAAKAGLKVGDIITKVDDAAITSPEDLSKAVGSYKPNEKITITYKRNKKDQKVTTTLGKRPPQAMTYNYNFDEPQDFHFDFDQKELDEQLRSLDEMRGDMKVYGFRGPNAGPKLGIKAQDTEDGKGVKVLSVEDSSNAAKSGLKEGDIITSFDDKSIANTEQLVEASREAREKSTIPVKVTRNGINQDLEIKIPRKLRTANL
ncbi:PDZ domain-containing protein [Pinibacter aurantiacus]|uniref:PDZ domain-containing protein n=1 Tax=Pinibacter aurantiacus TaxID=2851599 RepID=A0A9E2S7M5_9BACT|nr:PDZ domain-containing protein [Pinibacter aurantiacus]MBV4357102.1 PDZ domain-containing protein [Pinibacter aurantiacus]